MTTRKPVDLSRHEGHTPGKLKVTRTHYPEAKKTYFGLMVAGDGPLTHVFVADVIHKREDAELFADAPALRDEVVALRRILGRLLDDIQDAGESGVYELDEARAALSPEPQGEEGA